MSASGLLNVVIGALGVGLPTLLYSMWRGRRMAPREEDDLVTRAAGQAVEAMSEVLAAARLEREEMQRTLERRNTRIGELERRLGESSHR